MTRGRSIVLALGVLFACSVSGAQAADDELERRATPGSAGLGDPLFPRLGNGGYDVQAYDLDLDYRPKPNRLTATAVIDAVATQDLSRFDLDFRNDMKVSVVEVDGQPAAFDRGAAKLEITPPAPIADGASFETSIAYRGEPGTGRLAVPGERGPRIGWVPIEDGAWVANEPDGASRWFPSNDHPSDKATFSISIEVPRKLAAVSNGELLGVERDGDRKIWSWRMNLPMATYLATATIGPFRIDDRPIAGIPSYVAYDESLPGKPEAELPSLLPPALDTLAAAVGPYPFDSTGGIVVDGPPGITYYLETQTRPLYNAHPRHRRSSVGAGGIWHETAHQWFGDAVTPSRWKDIWLNEGIASWAAWLVDAKVNGETGKDLARTFDFYFRIATRHRTREELKEYWNPPPARIEQRSEMFDSAVYIRGAMTIQALYDEIGREDLLEVLSRWVADNRYGNVTTSDFTDLAEEVSGRDLDRFFRIWLKRPGAPKNWSDSPATLARASGPSSRSASTCPGRIVARFEPPSPCRQVNDERQP